jgi:hypothetical protein
MLSIEECKKYLAGLELTDKEVEELRNSLYFIITNILDNNFEKQYENHKFN